MRRTAILMAFASTLFMASALDAGTANQPFTVVKDPQAVLIAQNAIAAMGGPQALLNYQDSVATGTLTVFGGTSPLVIPVTLKSKGTHETRVELQRSNGVSVRLVNQGQGTIQKPDGTVRTLVVSNLVGERVSHIPLLSLLAEYQNANIGLGYQGTAPVNAQSTQVIALTYVPTSDPVQGPLFASTTQTLLYVDQTTNLIDKVQYKRYPENDQSNPDNIEVYFANYQSLRGISVPFHQTTFTNGSLESDLVLSNADFNVGLADSEFTLPQ